MFNGDKTYDNRTEEIHRSQRTTYREGNYQFAGTSNLSGWRLEGSCPHGGVGVREVNWVQGCIQSVPKLGMRTGMPRNTAEQLKKH